MAAMEPLPQSQLEAMGFGQAVLEALPGWGTLFFAADHRVFFLHKSLADWLRLARSNGARGYEWGGGVSGGGRGLAAAGHLRLGRHLVEREALAAEDGGYQASEYALKYAAHHLCLGGAMAELDRLLGHWPFLRQVMAAGQGAALVQARGSLEASS